MKSVVDQCTALLRLARSLDWLGPLSVRLVFGYFWFETGWAKLHNLDGAIQRFVGWGLPYPEFTAPFSAATELVGGALLMLGLFTRLISIPMIINMVVALLTVAIKPVAAFDDFFDLDEPLYIVVFLWFLIAGPGRVSLDTWLAKTLGIDTGKAI
ncbi:MAG: DoxX family protein [Nevskia sp.]|nr:DoxX family protein [Nevskia sp.]